MLYLIHNKGEEINTMIILINVILTIVAIIFLVVATTTIVHDGLPIDKTPDWLEDLYYFIWR